MTKKIPNEWATYSYIDPVVYVTELQKVRAMVAAGNTPKNISNLRTRKLAPQREAWDAGVFCYLLRERTGREIYFAAVEDADYDAVFTWKEGDTQRFAPVQMKEVVPEELNPRQKLQDVLNKLKRYVTSDDLVVAIKLNRRECIETKDVILSDVPVAEVWFFGAIDPNGKKWSLFRKTDQGFELSEHELPKPNKWCIRDDVNGAFS